MEGASLSPGPTRPAVHTDHPPHSAWGARSLRSTHAALGTMARTWEPLDHVAPQETGAEPAELSRWPGQPRLTDQEPRKTEVFPQLPAGWEPSSLSPPLRHSATCGTTAAAPGRLPKVSTTQGRTDQAKAWLPVHPKPPLDTLPWWLVNLHIHLFISVTLLFP